MELTKFGAIVLGVILFIALGVLNSWELGLL